MPTVPPPSRSAGRERLAFKPAMPEDQSVTRWIANLKQGDETAAESLWQRYFQRRAGLARQRLGDGDRRVQDEDDIALSVFKSLCGRAERDDLAELEGRDDLWRLLATITVRKAAGQIRDAGRLKPHARVSAPARRRASSPARRLGQRNAPKDRLVEKVTEARAAGRLRVLRQYLRAQILQQASGIVRVVACHLQEA